MELAAPLLAAAITLTGNCWVDAAKAYGLPAHLLYAIGEVESNHNPEAIAHANNGTHSVGLMQVNSSWFDDLEKHGITEQDLYDPCTNISVGAWILRQEVDRYGYSWEAIGAYYAGPYNEENGHWKLPLYREYAEKVITRWKRNLKLALTKK